MDAKKNLKRSLTGCIKQLSWPQIEHYLTLGGDLNKVLHKTTLLCEASRKGHFETAEKLLEAGADVNVVDTNGCSPLYIAASHGDVALVKHLISAGAHVDQKNQSGFTPLVSALQNSHNDCASVLIENGACVNTDRPKNSYGATVSLLTYILFAKGDWDMAEALLKAGIKPTKFIPPLGFILLEDPTTPVPLIEKFVYAGFDVQVKGWVDLATRRGSELTDTQRELVDLIEKDRKSVPHLQRLCRTVIRNCLTQSITTPNVHISRKIDGLPIPLEVMKYLKLEYL